MITISLKLMAIGLSLVFLFLFLLILFLRLSYILITFFNQKNNKKNFEKVTLSEEEYKIMAIKLAMEKYLNDNDYF